MRIQNVSHYFLIRSRPLYAATGAVVIATGFLWRSQLLPLPVSVAKYGGDAWWALLVFIGFGFFLNTASTLRIAVLAACFAGGVEFFQLYHAAWIDAVRATRAGHLVLGSTFNAPDFLAYAAGIVLGALTENLLVRSKLAAPPDGGKPTGTP
ncbi:MAG TPA: DUF2809 domain-containing protein [Rariglobus sp.]|nr:DUF2809 domain-containing protein [Rariglobus sp.]